jgi:hypothetical protein
LPARLCFQRISAFKGRHLADLTEAFAAAGLPYDGLFMAAARRAKLLSDAGGCGGMHAGGARKSW